MTDTELARAERLLAERERLAELCQDLIRRARAGGASAAEATAGIDAGLAVTVRKGEVESLEFTRDLAFDITVYRGQRKANASCADLSPASLNRALDEAMALAAATEADPAAGLADADELAQALPDLDLWHPSTLSTDEAIERAREIEAAALALDPRITNSEGGSVSHGMSVGVYANSHGFVGSGHATRFGGSCSVVAEDGDSMERDYDYTQGRELSALDDGAAIGRRAAERALARLHARQLTTRTAQVVFDADLACSFFGHLVSASSGSQLYRRASFLLDRAGSQILPPAFNLVERPHLKRAMGSAAFDNDGVATREALLVDRGVLARYVLSSYSARKLGLRTTANAGGVHNLCVLPTVELGLAGLLREMGEGLLVTELLGQGANIVTGDYSRGAAGFWIENGQVAYPVAEITIAGNLSSLYQSLVAVGNDIDTRGRIRCGSLWIGPMTVAGS